MNLLSPVSTIMTPNPIVVGATESLAVVAKIFSTNNLHHLPVISEGKLVGLVSKSDFLLFKRGFNTNEVDNIEEEVRLKNYTAGHIMTSRLAKLEPSDRINVALEVFKENLFHALPVVENDRVIGIVTTYDIINHLAKDASATAQY